MIPSIIGHHWMRNEWRAVLKECMFRALQYDLNAAELDDFQSIERGVWKSRGGALYKGFFSPWCTMFGTTPHIVDLLWPLELLRRLCYPAGTADLPPQAEVIPASHCVMEHLILGTPYASYTTQDWVARRLRGGCVEFSKPSMHHRAFVRYPGVVLLAIDDAGGDVLRGATLTVLMGV